MDNNNQNGGFNQGYYDPQAQNQPYGQAPQGMPYGQNAQYQQGMPYGQDPQFQQGMPYGQNPQFQQNMPYGQAPQSMSLGQPAPSAPKKKKTGLIIGIVLGVLLLIGGGVFATMMILNNKAEKDSKAVVEAFFDGYNKQDLDAMYDCFHPDIRDAAKEQTMSNYGNGSGAATEAEYWQFFNDYFGGLKIEYKIEKQKKLKGDELSDVLDTANSFFGVNFDCKNVYAFKLNETYSGSNGSQVQEETVVVGKVDGNWYIILAATDKIISNDVVVTTEETTEEVTTEEQTTEEVTTEEQTTEEVTTEQGASTGVAASADGFDWDKMQFTCKGVAYNLKGLTYADIEAMGFVVEDSYLNEQLEDNKYTLSIRAEASDESDIYVRFKNFTGGGAKAVRDCEILGISLSRDSWHNQYDAALGNGITFGMSMDDVKAIMGEPSDEYISDDSDYASLDYEADDEVYSDSVSFIFGEDGLKEIELESYQ